MRRLMELTGLYHPVGIIVGLPLSGEGTEEASASSAREMAAAIARQTGLPLDLWDERMSTARALGAIQEQGGSTRGRRAEIDALAAAVLLQHYLDSRAKRPEMLDIEDGERKNEQR
jgi:putative Holliday junction resolvase